MTLKHRGYLKPTAIAALTCALVLLASAAGEIVEGKTPAVAALNIAETAQKESTGTGEAAGILASSFVRPVDITDWDPETDPKRLEPAVLANLSVAICDDHFPAGSLARTQIEEGLALFEANGVNINITYVNDTQYVPHKPKATLFAEPPSVALQIDYVDNAVGADDSGPFPCHPTVGDTKCSQVSGWTANTCRYSSVDGWNAGPETLQQAAAISINAHCTGQYTQTWTTNPDDVFNLNGMQRRQSTPSQCATCAL